MAPNKKPVICLRWENHQNKLIKSFRSLLNNGRFTDVTLAADGRFLSAHRVILSAYSSYFEELLSLHMESQTIVFLQGIAFEELQMIVDFMYKGEIEIESGKVVPFYAAAESLKIRALMQHQGLEETKGLSVILRLPRRQREAECPAQTSADDSCQASGGSEGIHHLQQVQNRLPATANAVDTNSLSHSPVGEETATEDSYFALESENEGSDSEENSITIKEEEIIVPRYESYYPEDSGTNGNEANDLEAPGPSGMANQIPGQDSGTNGNEVNDLEAAGPSGLANQIPGQVSLGYNLRKRTPAVILQPSNTGSLAGTSRSESSTLERSASSSSDLSENSKRTSRTTRFDKTPNFVCQQCSKSYRGPKALRVHQRLYCGKQPSLACGICDKRYHSKYNLKKHSVVAHNSSNFQCPRCSKSYKWPNNLLRHERFYCGKEPSFACGICDKRYYSKDKLRRHRVGAHTYKKFQCPRCPKSFTASGELLRHGRFYCGKEPSFTCVTCDRRFYRKYDLKKHRIDFHEPGDT